MTIEDQLGTLLSKFDSPPILFIGSGIGRRYFGADTWKALLERFSARLPQSFEYYYATASRDLPRVAGLMAPHFHELWWNSKDFEESRARHKSQVDSPQTALKIEIANYVEKMEAGVTADPDLLAELELLKTLDIDAVVTTNWDCFLERILFPGFKVFIGQAELVKSVPQGIAEIYKIHGCRTQPGSMILTDADYGLFNTRYPYLAAKLLTLFAERPVIFLGYSISDPNIAELIQAITTCIPGSDYSWVEQRLIVVEYDLEKRGDTIGRSTVLANGFPVPVTNIRAFSYLSIYRAISKVKRKIPARLLRALKEQVYHLVRTTDPKGRMYVADLDDDDLDWSKIEIVAGAGMISEMGKTGYAGLKTADLIDDLLDEKKLEAEQVVTVALPELIKKTKLLPVFKYLRGANRIAADGKLTGVLDPRLQDAAAIGAKRFDPPEQIRLNAESKMSTKRLKLPLAGVVPYVEASLGIPDALYALTVIDPKRLNPGELRAFLQRHRALRDHRLPWIHTSYKRLACVLDWIMFR